MTTPNNRRGWHVNIACEIDPITKTSDWSVSVFDELNKLVLFAPHGTDGDGAYEDYYVKVEQYQPSRRKLVAVERGQRYLDEDMMEVE